jgi:PQQ-dependent catabolism-associated CXXCW motif protein
MRSLLLLMVTATVSGARPALAQDSFGGTPAPAQPTRPQTAPANGSPYGPAPAQTGGGDLDRLMQEERKDFGVQPTGELHTGGMHAPTPASIPGGQVITTKGLIPLLGNAELGALLFDVLGGQEMIPGARGAVPASQPGSFSDQNQQDFGRYLESLTRGNKETPLVFYCLSSHCWMSYNASLRAIHLGYRNVLWYRGGIEAWKAAGQRVQQAGQNGQ